jgi:phage head maturation protease
MVKSGTLRAASVGFAPGQWEFSKDKSRPNGIDFISGHTLLEWSVVNVPANASCLCESIVGQKSASGASKTPKLDTARRKIARLRHSLVR